MGESVSSSHGWGWMGGGGSRPPANELPVALATPEILWRGEGIVLAIPAMHVYTSGVEVFIFCRTTDIQPREISHAREIGSALDHGLKVSGTALHAQHGDHEDYGFTYRSWVPFAPDQYGNDLVFALDWPGIMPGQRGVSGEKIAAAIGRVSTLWPSA